MSFGKPASKIAGTRGEAAAERRVLFKQAYMANGHNQTQAAITAGYSVRTAHEKGRRLRMELEASGELAAAAEQAATEAKLTTRRTLQEVGRVAYNDTRRFYREDGSTKAPKEWDDDMAAAVSSIEAVPVVLHGFDEPKIGYTYKLKFWNKNDALEKAMRHGGLYEKDNRQLAPNLAIQVNLVEPSQPVPPAGPITITLKPTP